MNPVSLKLAAAWQRSWPGRFPSAGKRGAEARSSQRRRTAGRPAAPPRSAQTSPDPPARSSCCAAACPAAGAFDMAGEHVQKHMRPGHGRIMREHRAHLQPAGLHGAERPVRLGPALVALDRFKLADDASLKPVRTMLMPSSCASSAILRSRRRRPRNASRPSCDPPRRRICRTRSNPPASVASVQFQHCCKTIAIAQERPLFWRN